MAPGGKTNGVRSGSLNSSEPPPRIGSPNVKTSISDGGAPVRLVTDQVSGSLLNVSL